MKRRTSLLRCGFRPEYVLLSLLAVGLIGCPEPGLPDPHDLLPTPPEELPDLAGQVVTVGLPADNLPYSQIDPLTDAVTGFDYELITTMASRLNFTPRFVAVEPATLEDDLAAGRLDVAGGGIAYTVARAARFDFVSPYGLVKLRLAVRQGEARVETIAEFHDAVALRIGTWAGTRTHDLTAAFVGAARVVGFDSTEAAVDALVAGEVDGVALDDPELAREQARLPGTFVALPGLLGGDVAAYALPRGSDLTDALNDAFLQLQAEGEIAALRDEWGL